VTSETFTITESLSTRIDGVMTESGVLGDLKVGGVSG
jgi:hypothetical protein